MDVSSGFDIPNAYGLGSRDFDHDMDSYRTALSFLSDLTGGTDEARALEVNGADVPMLRHWESSARFRRVLAKCRAGAARERAALGAREAEDAEPKQAPSGQRFIPFDEMPAAQLRVFRMRPPASFGGA